MPTRKTLPHDVPWWIDPADEIYFITICCKQRGLDQLTTSIVAPKLMETIKHRNTAGTWFAYLALLMPDHLHMLITFPEVATTGPKVGTTGPVVQGHAAVETTGSVVQGHASRVSLPSAQARISSWKSWTAKTCGIQWQRDFFEHRLRKEESYREKADYILLNPVRADLVERPEDWPHVFIADVQSGSA